MSPPSRREMKNRLERLALSVLHHRLAICRLPADAALPAWCVDAQWYSVTRTEDELSVVVPEERIPPSLTAEIERGWRALKVQGPLEFSMTGVLANLSVPLADGGVSIFAISTYDTDYILVRSSDLDRAVAILREQDYAIQ